MESLDLVVGRRLQDGRFVVTNNGPDIHVGATFREIWIGRFDGPNTALVEHLKQIGAVNFAVETADIQRKNVDLVPRGWSAAIHLSGTGEELLVKALAERGDRQHVHLTG